MTAPTIQQTTPVIISIPERCETGISLIKARTAAVDAAKTVEEFYLAEGKGWLKYCRHVAKCDACQTYELWRKNEQDTRFSSQESRR